MVTAKQLKQWREQTGMTQRVLAEKLDVSIVCVSDFERGATRSMVRGTMRRLEELMISSGASIGAREDAWKFLAGELRSLADAVESATYPLELKVSRFVDYIMHCHKNLAQLKAMIIQEEK